jgi:hypothetical protein
MAPTSKPTTLGKKWRRKAKRVQARAVRLQLKLQKLQLQGQTGRRFKRVLERGLSRGIGCMEGDEEVYCFVVINKVGGEPIDQETSTLRRRLVDLQEVEFDVVDPSGQNGATIEKNIVEATTSNDGDENALLANLQQEAYNEGLLTEDLALMTASQMGTPTVEQTTITTYEDEEYSADAASQETGAVASAPKEDETSMTPVIAGACAGLVLILLVAGLVLKSRSSVASSASHSTQEAPESDIGGGNLEISENPMRTSSNARAQGKLVEVEVGEAQATL